MAQDGQPPDNKPQEFSGCFCVVVGFIVGSIFFSLVGPAAASALTRPAPKFYQIAIGLGRGEVVALLGIPKVESLTNPLPPNTYEHQCASRSDARHYLIWEPFRGPRHVVGLDSQGTTVFKCTVEK